MTVESAFSRLSASVESSIKLRLKSVMSIAAWYPIGLNIALKERCDWLLNLKKKYWCILPKPWR
jgi:hypothetical protein